MEQSGIVFERKAGPKIAASKTVSLKNIYIKFFY